MSLIEVMWSSFKKPILWSVLKKKKSILRMEVIWTNALSVSTAVSARPSFWVCSLRKTKLVEVEPTCAWGREGSLPAPTVCQALAQVLHTPRLHLNFMLSHTQRWPLRAQVSVIARWAKADKEPRFQRWSVSNTPHFSIPPGSTSVIALMNVSHVK